jgi:hypothetical protein
MEKALKILNSCEIVIEGKNEREKFVFPNTTCRAGRASLAKKILDIEQETSKLGVAQFI